MLMKKEFKNAFHEATLLFKSDKNIKKKIDKLDLTDQEKVDFLEEELIKKNHAKKIAKIAALVVVSGITVIVGLNYYKKYREAKKKEEEEAKKKEEEEEEEEKKSFTEKIIISAKKSANKITNKIQRKIDKTKEKYFHTKKKERKELERIRQKRINPTKSQLQRQNEINANLAKLRTHEKYIKNGMTEEEITNLLKTNKGSYDAKNKKVKKKLKDWSDMENPKDLQEYRLRDKDKPIDRKKPIDSKFKQQWFKARVVGKVSLKGRKQWVKNKKERERDKDKKFKFLRKLTPKRFRTKTFNKKMKEINDQYERNEKNIDKYAKAFKNAPGVKKEYEENLRVRRNAIWDLGWGKKSFEKKMSYYKNPKLKKAKGGRRSRRRSRSRSRRKSRRKRSLKKKRSSRRR